MELIRLNLDDNINLNDNIVAAIGQFDGLHLAHRKLITTAVDIAKEKVLKSAVITFDPHPDYILNKRENLGYLTPVKDKVKEIKKLGVDILIFIEFSLETSQLSPSEFENIFFRKLNINTLVAGFDYRYGYRGSGNVERLQSLGLFDVIVINEIKYNNKKMGSELIRKNLENGNIEVVNEMLGRYYRICGTVVAGNKVGRTLGFKTANIQIDENYHFIKKGVYAVIVTVRDIKYLGVCNIGNNPSVNYTEKARLEVHLLDFNDEIYDEEICVDFVLFIRDELKFDDIEQLIEAINQDVITTKERLKYLI